MRKLPVAHFAIALLAFAGLGCNGLTVRLSANPDRADPGDPVEWTVSVRNDTHCTTTDAMVDPPDEVPDFPDTVGAFALFFGFVPQLDELGPEAFCRLIMSCNDLSCVETQVGESLGPEAAAAFDARMQAATADPPASLPALGTCQEIGSISDGIVGLCVFDTLDPGETGTATFMTTAPDTGSRNAAQVAVAFAPATGEDCRPGLEVGEDQWVLGGCFPRGGRTAPALSPIITGVAAGLLLIVGVAGVYRRRRS